MFWSKKNKCEHDWHELETRSERVYDLVGLEIDYTSKDFTYVYCPLCDTQQRLYKEDWTLRKKTQDIRRQYKIQ